MSPATTLLALQRTIQQRKEDTSGTQAPCHKHFLSSWVYLWKCQCPDREVFTGGPKRAGANFEGMCSRWETIMDSKVAEQPRAVMQEGEGGGWGALSDA